MKRFFLCSVLACFFAFLPLPTHAALNPLLGYWQTQDGDGVVEFYACDNAYCGRFVWLKDDSEAHPSRDNKNQDVSQRDRFLCGMTFLGGFNFQENGLYDGGWIYSPRHGHVFSAEMNLTESDELHLRGYVLFSFLGGNQLWHRVSKPANLCWALDPQNKKPQL